MGQRHARKPYCPKCGRTSALFKYEIKKDLKTTDMGTVDELIMTCVKCDYKYYLYSKPGEGKWKRKNLMRLEN